jgi:trans-aconitate 3-methyltransferase
LHWLTIIVYGNVAVVGHPELNPILQKYSYGGPGTMGPYWEEPGRSIVVSLYRNVVPPEALYKDVTRHFFPRKTDSGDTEKILEIRNKMTIRIMRPYVRTWSSYHGWQNDFPEKKSRESGGAGDIVDEMFDALKDATGWEENTEFEVGWSSGILLARKKEV